MSATADHPTGIKSTREQIADRVVLSKKMLLQGHTIADVKRFLKGKYDVSAQTASGYMRRARDEILADTGLSREEHRGDSYGMYLSVQRDPEATNFEKLKARERIDKLLGLEAPARVNVASVEDEVWGTNTMLPTIPEMLSEARALVSDLLPRVGLNGHGDGNGQGNGKA